MTPERGLDVIFDLEGADEDQAIACDVCIVGGGPAGITIASELRKSGLSICLAESGGLKQDEKAMSLYEGASVGQPIDLTLGRFRVLGGASTRWGGRCAVLDPLDFEHRDWVNGSEWPISYDEMSLHYERAKSICNFKEAWLPIDAVGKALDLGVPEFKRGKLVPFVWRVAAPSLITSFASKISLGYRTSFNFGTEYRDTLADAKNLTTIIHANLREFSTNESGDLVESATLSTMSGRLLIVKAKRFVVACSGIENAKILLNLPDRTLSRINENGNIGRYFNQHPRGLIGLIRANRAQGITLQKTFNNFLRPGRVSPQYEIGFALSEQVQRRDRLLNASVGLYYEVDDESIWKAGKRLRDSLKKLTIYPSILRDIGIIAVGVPFVGVNIIRRYVLGREVIHGRPVIRAVIDLEQEPDPESRIYLSEERDPMGMRKAVVDWRIGEKERETARAFADFLDEELQDAGLGVLEKSRWLTLTTPIQSDELTGNLHFIGATRMAADSRSGVVDRNCKVFGAENLYVAGASVFTTGGHANPMVTIVALAERLATHLASLYAAETLERNMEEETPLETVLILGATGFIGSHVAAALLASGGIRLVVGLRASADMRGLRPEALRREIDLDDEASLRMAMEGCSTVINCARFPAGEGPASHSMTNVLNAASKAGVKRLIHMSSIAVYGEASGEITEATAPVQPVNSYGREKRICEEICAAHASPNLKIVVLRPSLVYGEGGEEWTEYFLRGIGSGKLQRLELNGGGTANLVYVKDVAEFCKVLVKSPIPDFSVVNVNGDDLPIFNDYFSLLAKAAFGKELGSVAIGPRYWTARRTILKILRKSFSLPLLRSLVDFRQIMFLDDGYSKYIGRKTYRNDAAKKLGFTPRYSAKDGVDDMMMRVEGPRITPQPGQSAA